MTSAYVDWNTAQVAHLLLKIGPKTSRWRQLHPHQHHASHGAPPSPGPSFVVLTGNPAVQLGLDAPAPQAEPHHEEGPSRSSQEGASHRPSTDAEKP